MLAADTAGTDISSSYDAGTGVLTLSGSDLLAHYQQVLATITYNNTIGDPGTGSLSFGYLETRTAFRAAAPAA